MLTILRCALLALICSASAVFAQDTWIQIEARPSLSEAQDRASTYARRMESVHGFRLGSTGWYAIALGPFTEAEAVRERRLLRESGLIPGDSFTTDGTSFGERFWPIGRAQNQEPGAGDDGEISVQGLEDELRQERTGDEARSEDRRTAAEGDAETPEEARLAERLLSESERREVQLALRRTGFYRGAIDGEFGRPTRSAMAAWQGENDAEATGVLTTAQRRALLAQDEKIVAEAEPEAVVETPAEARRSEATLSQRERADLQRALAWEGYYQGRIDAAFGRGTRGAMAEWQTANGYDATGVLTTRQRRSLIKEYNAVLDGLGMKQVRDDTAGIEIEMPTEKVAFDRYEPPFAHYAPEGDAELPKVLLISQRGNRDTLHGLYDIMQTLEIVPADGRRNRTPTSFVLEGKGKDFVSHTEARLTGDGHVKGFTLIWKAGDEKRRGRVLDEMQASFEPLPGIVMDDSVAEPDEDQSVDLLSGLQIRKPEVSRSGFYIDDNGAVLTTSEVLGQCRRITLNDDIEAEVTARDDKLGLALLNPKQSLSPMAYARFQAGVPRLQSKIAVSGYSFEGVLGGPTLSFGTIADLRGLSGEETMKRLAVSARPGDVGGPVLDQSGAVLGMLLPQSVGSSEKSQLPGDVSFAADVETIAGFLSGEGMPPRAAEASEALGPEELTMLASDMTVLVSCWN